MRFLTLAILFTFPSDVVIGQTTQAPNFALKNFARKNIKGRTVRLSDYKGKVVLLNFWATWCPPCLAEMPELVKLQKEYQGRGLQIIGITYASERHSRLSKVVTKLRINYTMLFGTKKVAAMFDVGEVLPVTVVIDREGIVRDRIIGILEPEEFEQKVKPLLK